jgi:transcriptional regulator with PAS, ATPase and Fis domain
MYLPPLRERPDDIPLLVRRFVKDYSAQHDRPFHGISAEAMQILVSYSWPGNVRELRNLVESMVVPTYRERSGKVERRDFFRCMSVRCCVDQCRLTVARWSSSFAVLSSSSFR